MNCRHCSAVLRTAYAPRRLCWSCYRTPGMTDRYGRIKTGPKSPGEEPYRPAPKADDEPTADELDAIIAEQGRSLPDWWHR